MKPQKKKNMSRLGGKGLSLESFANAKTKNPHYNPALLKKQREFYKNAKHVNKFKKSQKQQSERMHPHLWSLLQNAEEVREAAAEEIREAYDEEGGEADAEEVGEAGAEEVREAGEMSQMRDKGKKNSGGSLNELYEKKREKAEKERREKEAIIQAKKKVRENAESKRKAIRGKMFKKTKFGQPVMKYRIEHLLETIQASTSS